MVAIHTFASRGSLYMHSKHSHMKGLEDSETKCVCSKHWRFAGLHFNLGVWKCCQKHNCTTPCLQRLNVIAYAQPSHTLTTTAYRDSTTHTAEWVEAMLFALAEMQKTFPLIPYESLLGFSFYETNGEESWKCENIMQWGSQTRDFRADSSFKTTVKTHFSSLSSRNVSFFCFLISSKLRRASARSLTARSLSRRRLSHRVLQKGEKGDCE